MIKVCIITSSFPRQENSYEGIFIKRFIEQLISKVKYTVLAPSDSKQATAIYKKYDVFWIRYSLKKWENLFYIPGGIPQKMKRSIFSFWNFPFYILSMGAAAIKHAQKNDVIHVQWLQNGIFAILPKILFKKPIVITIHGSDYRLFQKNITNKLIGKIIIHYTDAIITVNKEFENELKQKYPHKRIDYIPYAYEISQHISSAEKENTPLTILFVGSLTEEKGIYDLMDVFEKVFLKHNNIQLRIVGDGAILSDVEVWAKKFNHDVVKICGILANEMVIKEMQQADLLVLPSYKEGRPTVVVEAMANGLPVLATKLPGILEIVTDGYNGKLFTPGDKEAFYNALNLILEDESLRKKYTTNSFNFLYDQNLVVEYMINSHLKLYHSLLTETETQ